jgi:hypothetical protein
LDFNEFTLLFENTEKSKLMVSPVPNADYYAIQFPDYAETAAFLAALSQYLNTPEGSEQRRGVELWGRLGRDQTITLFLNDIGVNAAADAFGQPPSGETYSGLALPTDCLLLANGRVDVWGIEQAEAYLRTFLI